MSKVLVIGPSWVGDMVMAQTLFCCLKSQGAAQIDVLAPLWSKPLLERMPEVHQALEFPLGHGVLDLHARWSIGRSLAKQYAQAIVLPGSFKSALVPFFAGVARRTGWRGEMRYGLLNDLRVLGKTHYPLMIEQFMALAYPKDTRLPKPYPRPALTVSAHARQQALARLQLTEHSPILALCPGAEFGEAKRWPAEHYAAVASAKIRLGWQVWLFGSAKDHPVGKAIKNALPLEQAVFCSNLAGATSLAEAIDLLACASAVVSNDSGLMHVAAALQRPLVAVYGSSSPQFTPPLSEQVVSLQESLPCSPCFERTCRFGHTDCLRQLSPSRVLQALDTLIQPATGEH